ncbi:MAG TPA: VanZ family protein [bacterium]|nr:VanZ family protein [bacterium]HNT65972.1 VanZ family protein [bacterium]HOX85988.1 VanZ family protein [bacterium]HPG45029.1 VanZ family protein [bacterium]HPM97271.1 VanZ family protein [bacterium]
MKRYGWRRFAPAGVWTLLLLVLTSLPKMPTPDLGFNAQDKLFHLLAYAVFAWLWLRGLTADHSRPVAPTVWMVIGGGLLYAAFDELHQEWIPGRFADIGDWMADAAGILLAAGLFYWLHRKTKTIQQKVSNTSER